MKAKTIIIFAYRNTKNITDFSSLSSVDTYWPNFAATKSLENKTV